jgi:hypothetical protein
MQMSPKRRISFFIDQTLAEGLKALKQRDGAAEGESIRRAILAYLEKQGVPTGDVKAERKRAVTRPRS